MFETAHLNEKVLGNLSLRVLRDKLIQSDNKMHAFLDSFTADMNDIVCVAEMAAPRKGEDRPMKHKHTVIYTNSVNEVTYPLADFKKLTTSEQSTVHIQPERLTSKELDKIKLKR